MSGAVDGADLRPELVAIVVSHDGARWLPRLLRALEESVVTPDLVLGVDAGSGDDSARLLTQSFGPERVLRLPRRTSFGDAVAATLDWLGEGDDDRSTCFGAGTGAVGVAAPRRLRTRTRRARAAADDGAVG